MSSLTTCSGQRVVVQGERKEKEHVVEDIRNRSSQIPSILLSCLSFTNATSSMMATAVAPV